MELLDKVLPYVTLASVLVNGLQILLNRKSKAERKNLELNNRKLEAELANKLNTKLTVEFIRGGIDGKLIIYNQGSSLASDIKLSTPSQCFFCIAEQDKHLLTLNAFSSITLRASYNDDAKVDVSVLEVSWTNESGSRDKDQFQLRSGI